MYSDMFIEAIAKGISCIIAWRPEMRIFATTQEAFPPKRNRLLFNTMFGAQEQGRVLILSTQLQLGAERHRGEEAFGSQL